MLGYVGGWWEQGSVAATGEGRGGKRWVWGLISRGRGQGLGDWSRLGLRLDLTWGWGWLYGGIGLRGGLGRKKNRR